MKKKSYKKKLRYVTFGVNTENTQNSNRSLQALEVQKLKPEVLYQTYSIQPHGASFQQSVLLMVSLCGSNGKEN